VHRDSLVCLGGCDLSEPAYAVCDQAGGLEQERCLMPLPTGVVLSESQLVCKVEHNCVLEYALKKYGEESEVSTWPQKARVAALDLTVLLAISLGFGFILLALLILKQLKTGTEELKAEIRRQATSRNMRSRAS